MQVLQFEERVTAREEFYYRAESGYFEAIRDKVARGLASKALIDGALYRRVDPDDKEDPFGIVRHVWSIGIERDMSEVEARERQMEEARRQGMRDAAKIVMEMAGPYRSVGGPCSHVLRNELVNAARRIEDAANEQKKEAA